MVSLAHILKWLPQRCFRDMFSKTLRSVRFAKDQTLQYAAVGTIDIDRVTAAQALQTPRLRS